MSRHTTRSTLALLLAGITLAGSAAAAGAQERQRDDSFRWSGRAEAGSWLTVRNLNGGVRIEPGSGDQVQVRAVKSWRRGDPASVRVEVTRTGTDDRNVLVCALWNGSTVCNENEYRTRGSSERRRRDNDVSVELIVSVPRGVHVRGETVNGSVDVTGASGQVLANSVNGNVTATSTGGPVVARSVNGNVHARMGSVGGSEDLTYATVNGNVMVEFTGGLDADIEMSTVNGGFETNFPLPLRGRINPRHIRATLGEGGRRIKLSTVNGNVELRRNAQ